MTASLVRSFFRTRLAAWGRRGAVPATSPVASGFGQDRLALAPGRDRAPIDRLYQEVLGRDADPDGVASSQAQMDTDHASGYDDAEVLQRLRQTLKTSEEYRVFHGDALIDDLYRRLLARPADADGLAYHQGIAAEVLSAGGSGQDVYDALVASITGSDEYRSERVETWIDADTLAHILGSPVENVRAYWPLLADALAEHGLTDRATVVAALATISVEDREFAPIPEYDGGWAYEGRADLGNVVTGDGPRFKGRGFIQLTGRANYRSLGATLGLDLEHQPDLALEPATAARVFAAYFATRGAADAARAGDLAGVRVAVSGSFAGWYRFQALVNELSRAIPAA